MKVAVIGGTGGMGKMLARKLASKNQVIIGSRDPTKAKAAADEVPGATGAGYLTAAGESEAVAFAIPFSAIDSVSGLKDAAAGKLVISMINPMKMVQGLFTYALDVGSAAERLAGVLPKSRVATAFNNVPAGFLRDEVVPPVDILIAADAKETYEEAAELVRGIREMRPLYAGPLSEARVVESITPLVLNLARLNGTNALTTRFVTRKG
jgi:8-hydroxy-5-deazaflavin:NADPH oxidoreductase